MNGRLVIPPPPLLPLIGPKELMRGKDTEDRRIKIKKVAGEKIGGKI